VTGLHINYKEAEEFLKNCNNVYILIHQSPDGDCIGAGFALRDILEGMGKRSAVICCDSFSKKFDFITKVENNSGFEPDNIISVDVAGIKLLGKYQEIYGDRVQLCIDHHISNTDYAERTLLDGKASAACEILYKLVCCMGIELSDYAAMCIYTGIATDTGCFKFDNTSAETHEIIADIMRKHKLNYAKINREMFDIKSVGMLKMESAVIDVMEYYLEGKLTMICITGELLKRLGVDFNDLDGCASLPLQVEGVEVGITIKEKDKDSYKISMRSTGDVNVSEICRSLGGGGHIKASGCSLDGNLEDVKKILVEAVRKGMKL